MDGLTLLICLYIIVTNHAVECSRNDLLLLVDHLEENIVDGSSTVEVVNSDVLLLPNSVCSIFSLDHHSRSPGVLSEKNGTSSSKGKTHCASCDRKKCTSYVLIILEILSSIVTLVKRH